MGAEGYFRHKFFKIVINILIKTFYISIKISCIINFIGIINPDFTKFRYWVTSWTMFNF